MIIIPYQKMQVKQKAVLKQFIYSIVKKEILNYSINSVYAHFGRQTDHHSQHILNIRFLFR